MYKEVGLLNHMVKVKFAHLCPRVCDPLVYKVLGILQARILEWVAFHFSRGSYQHRNQTKVSSSASRFFTNWAIREAKSYGSSIFKFWSISVLFSIATRNEPSFSFLSTSSPALVISCFFVNSHPNNCEAIPHCEFDLSLPNNWRSFHEPASHLYVFFGNMSIQKLCPVLTG